MVSTVADTSAPRIAASADERRIDATDSSFVGNIVVVIVVVVVVVLDVVAPVGVMSAVAATSALRITASVDKRRINATDASNNVGANA